MLLKESPNLKRLVDVFDSYLKKRYEPFFGKRPRHPVYRLKENKVIHDSLWGTNRFSWLEMTIVDSPIFQRIRYIHQTGLAFLVYPSAHHTRFEHSLGVVTIASRIFDNLFQRFPDRFKQIAQDVFQGKKDVPAVFENLRAELRLAALLHDIGHSIHSHASEFVYGQLATLKEAAFELSQFAGEKKGAGEVISFCISRTDALKQLIDRAKDKVKSPQSYESELNYDNVSLLIIGRSSHPLLQFMGNIVSGPIDADKLDYLARDSSFAGLPLKYDLERLLYTIGLSVGSIGDDEKKLVRIYELAGSKVQPRVTGKYPEFDCLELRPPRQLISTIEQIIICKFMLFSYIYHHKKVRAAEGMLVRLLERMVANWKREGLHDEQILLRFMDLKDGDLERPEFIESRDKIIKEYSTRIVDRLLPRLVFGFVSNNRSKAKAKLQRFSARLAEPALGSIDRKQQVIDEFEAVLAREMSRQVNELDEKDALVRTGMWLDVPKAPSFEKTESLLIGDEQALSLKVIFPIKPWVDGYEANRYYIRVFAFSEYMEQAKKAVRAALREIVSLTDEEISDTEEFFS